MVAVVCEKFENTVTKTSYTDGSIIPRLLSAFPLAGGDREAWG